MEMRYAAGVDTVMLLLGGCNVIFLQRAVTLIILSIYRDWTTNVIGNAHSL